ncbi:MAG: ABC transporter permease [Candidatus Adiutrix sp.]|jgi:simple sugar transport system permease protein|nr:ABC transporter permease [Candidatus Adiutrix sp.]
MGGHKLETFLLNSIIPIIFLGLSAGAIYLSGYSAAYVVQEVFTRLGRNLFLVLALIIPIMAGMGLNFGMVLGAMAGQIALIMVVDWAVIGLPGLLLASIMSVPLAIVFGILAGMVLNRAKGSEMVTSFILGFFAKGVYDLTVLFGMGSIIPVDNPELVLSRGFGIRNAVSLIDTRGALDQMIMLNIEMFGQPIQIPLGTYLVIALFGLLIVWFRRTKLGQDMRAVSQSMPVAQAAGINVDRTRLLAIVISTVLGAFGQLIYLQNMGTLSTYNSHDQAAMYAIAALLVGGASVTRATLVNAVVGVLLFHILFFSAPMAGKAMLGKAEIGEYFRVFIAYGVIAAALVLHAWRRRRSESIALKAAAQNLAARQAGESA